MSQYSILRAQPTEQDGVVEMPIYGPGTQGQYKGTSVVIKRVVLRRFELWVRLEGWSRDVHAHEVKIEPTLLSVARQVP